MRLIALYVGPLLFWILLIIAGSTQAGDGEVSRNLLKSALLLLGASEFDVRYAALFPLDRIARRLAQIGVFFVLALLIVRAVQWGDPRLRWQAIACAFSGNTIFSLGAFYLRRWTPNRHGDIHDLLLNILGSVLALAITVAWFEVKRWETLWTRRQAQSKAATGAFYEKPDPSCR